MKKLLLPAFIVLTITAFAQENKAPYPSVYELLKSKGIPGKITYQFPLATNTNGEKISQEKIILLPVDNMPCLVPDVREFNMPVLKLSILGTPARR